MGKLVIRHLGKIVGEVNLKLGRMSIGRKSGDIVLDDPAVSGEHAVIETIGERSTIYDLNSTNGTFVDGKRVAAHQLANDQTIVIGEHALVYRDEVGPVTAPKPPGPTVAVDDSTALIRFAHLLVLEGETKGKRVSLAKESVTLDVPGKTPLRFTRIGARYLLEVEEPDEVRLNGHPMPSEGGVLLEDGDLIEVDAAKYRFHLE